MACPQGAIGFDFEPYHLRAGVGILIHKKENKNKQMKTENKVEAKKSEEKVEKVESKETESEKKTEVKVETKEGTVSKKVLIK